MSQAQNSVAEIYGVYDYGGYDQEYEVVVCGGGTSGIAAAIASARAGAKTLLIEKCGTVGGHFNVSGPPGFTYAHLFNCKGQLDVGGVVLESYNRLYKQGYALPHLRPTARKLAGYTFSYVDPDWWTLEMYDMLEESGATMLLDTLVVDVVKDGDRVTGVVVENVNGRVTIPAKVVIDCSGEAHVSKKAGCEIIEPDRDSMQPHSLCFSADGVDWEKLLKYINRNPEQFSYEEYTSCNPEQVTKEMVYDLYRKCVDIKELGEVMGFYELRDIALANGDWHPNSGAGFFLMPKEGGKILAHFQHSNHVDHALPSDAWDMTRSNIECRKQIRIAWRFFKKYVPGFENAYIVYMGTEVRVREGARVMGDYVFTKEDVHNEARFDDVIGLDSTPSGVAHTNDVNTLASAPGVLKNHGSYAIPYRVLVPRKVENFFVAGKHVSADHEAYLRFVQQTMVTGQAAGVAAALCVKHGITPREMEADVTELQRILLRQGAILSLPDDETQFTLDTLGEQ